MYQLSFWKRAERQYGELSAVIRERCRVVFDHLERDPFAVPGVKKIGGIDHAYRVRIGRWRVIYFLYTDTEHIEIAHIFLEKNKNDYLRILHSLS